MSSLEREGEPRDRSWTDWTGSATGEDTSGIGEYRIPSASTFSSYEAGMALTIGIFVIILAALILYAQYSGAIRWLLAIIVLTIITMFLVRMVLRRTDEPEPLGARRRPDVTMPGDLHGLGEIFDRASKGMKYSQVMFSVRLRDAFLNKVMASRGISGDKIRRIKGNPEALFDIIGDRELVVFLLEAERNSRDWSRVAAYMPPVKGYDKEIERIMAKMEAWS